MEDWIQGIYEIWVDIFNVIYLNRSYYLILLTGVCIAYGWMKAKRKRIINYTNYDILQGLYLQHDFDMSIRDTEKDDIIAKEYEEYLFNELELAGLESGVIMMIVIASFLVIAGFF